MFLTKWCLVVTLLCVVLLAKPKPKLCLNQVNGTVDDVWAGFKTAGDIILNITKPLLDNEIQKESQASLNTTLLEPINTTLMEHSKMLQYDRSSILLFNSDIALLKDGMNGLMNTSKLTNARLDQVNNKLGIMEVHIQLTVNNTDHLKKDLQELRDTVKDNSGLLTRLETKVNGLDTKVNGLETKVNGLDTKVNGLNTKVNGLNTKVNGLQDTVLDNSGKLTRLEDIVQNNTVVLTRLEDKITGNTLELRTLNDYVQNISIILTGLENWIKKQNRTTVSSIKA